MLKLQAGPWIDINTIQSFDNMGQPELEVTIEGNFELTTMKTDIDLLRSQLDSLLFQKEREEELRKTNPALQELYDQYQVVYTLVKKADTNVGNDGGG